MALACLCTHTHTHTHTDHMYPHTGGPSLVRFQLLCEPGQGKPSHMYMQAHTHSYAHAHANVHAGMHTRAHIEAQIGEVNAWGAVVILIWFNN